MQLFSCARTSDTFSGFVTSNIHSRKEFVCSFASFVIISRLPLNKKGMLMIRIRFKFWTLLFWKFNFSYGWQWNHCGYLQLLCEDYCKPSERKRHWNQSNVDTTNRVDTDVVMKENVPLRVSDQLGSTSFADLILSQVEIQVTTWKPDSTKIMRQFQDFKRLNKIFCGKFNFS